MGKTMVHNLATTSEEISAPRRRIYRVWMGNNKFLCGGRLVLGPAAASVMLTTVLIGAPAIAFCIKMFSLLHVGSPMFGYPVTLLHFNETIR